MILFFNNMSIAGKTALPGVLIALVVSALSFFVFASQQEDVVILQAEATAKAISKQVSAERAIYTSEVVGKLRKESAAVTTSASYEQATGAIPLPATFVHRTSAKVNASADATHSVNLLSLYNINPTKAPRDGWEKDALLTLETRPKEVISKVSMVDGKPVFFAATADIADADACVNCHNSLAVKGKTDFKLNDVMGGIVVSLPLEREFAQAKANATVLSFGLLAAFFFLLGLQWVVVNRPLVKSVTDLEEAAARISEGDVNTPFVSDRGDEIGRLAKAFDRMRASVAAAMEAMGDDDDEL